MESPNSIALPEKSQPEPSLFTDPDISAEDRPRRQQLRVPHDLYTPLWVRYNGHLREGFCDLCIPGKWMQLKNSAYWYHKQFVHGISSVSGQFFLNPLEERPAVAQDGTPLDTIEGLCHQCQTWVPVCGQKQRNRVLWYRHAHR
ncbi:hypothetical protein GQ42DRAFT_127507, partial [Ramicandelaber brevisporus]